MGQSTKSTFCVNFANKSILHKCKHAQWAWGYGQQMMNGLVNGTRRPIQQVTPLHWKHYVFVNKVGQDNFPTLLEYGL